MNSLQDAMFLLGFFCIPLTHFCSCYGGFEVGVLDWIRFFGVRISVDGVWGQWCGAFVGFLEYINIK